MLLMSALWVTPHLSCIIVKGNLFCWEQVKASLLHPHACSRSLNLEHVSTPLTIFAGIKRKEAFMEIYTYLEVQTLLFSNCSLQGSWSILKITEWIGSLRSLVWVMLCLTLVNLVGLSSVLGGGPAALCPEVFLSCCSKAGSSTWNDLWRFLGFVL